MIEVSAMIQGINYKIGVHGKVFWLNDGEWLLSSLPVEKYWLNIKYQMLRDSLSILKTSAMTYDKFVDLYPEHADEIIQILMSKKLLQKQIGLGGVEYLSVPAKVRREDSKFLLKKLAKGWCANDTSKQ